jgi:hypothetical protein
MRAWTAISAATVYSRPTNRESSGGAFHCGEQRARFAICHRVRNMFVFAIILGAIWVIGVFVFWCDVTDSWKKCVPWVQRTSFFRLIQNSPPRPTAPPD